MSGPYYNGADDDGLSVAMTGFTHRIDGAREAFVESGEPFGVDSVTPMVEALTVALAGVDLSPQEPQQPGWSARRNRGQV
ncbi:hypothetical protein [Streptomyces ossamyceticus]|uniref:hypothetical protein n=1 Tax=Streptomyces ossamyceticus TaxID=249581 RepID=UPI00344A84CB